MNAASGPRVGRRCAEFGVVAGSDTEFRPAKRAIAGNSTFATPAPAPPPSSVTRRASPGAGWASLGPPAPRTAPDGPASPRATRLIVSCLYRAHSEPPLYARPGMLVFDE